MITRIKSIVVRNRIIFENFSFLSILQISNLLVFLFIIPYLFKTLGKENYGLVVFAQTVAIYFSIFVNFGFNVVATRDISIYSKRPNKRTEIISAILSLKLFFFFLSIIFLSILVLTIPFLRSNPTIFYFSMLFCLSEALFPIWYFQGIERMKYITFINLATRIGSAILIFIFVKEPTDYIYVPLFLGIGTVLGAIIGLYIVLKIHKNKLILLSTLKLKTYVIDAFPLFISNLSSQIYVNANKLIVGSFLGMQEVALYDIADKIVTLLKVPITLVGRTLFPRVSRDKDIRFVKKTMKLVFAFFVIVYLGLFIFSNPIIYIFTNANNPVTVNLLRLLAVSIIPISLSLFLAELILVPFGLLKSYTKMRTFSMVFYLFVVFILYIINHLNIFTLASAIVLVETFATTYSYFVCKRNNFF